MSLVETYHSDLQSFVDGRSTVKTIDVINFESANPAAVGLLNEIRAGGLPKIKKGSYSLDRKFVPPSDGMSVTEALAALEMDKPALNIQKGHVLEIPEISPKASKPAHPLLTAPIPLINIPGKNSKYVKFGIYSDLKKIITSKKYMPVYVVGDSGNGKTLTTEQVCADLGRPFDLISVDAETGYDQLIAHTGLRDGNTFTEYGIVPRAMKAGAVLLLDEIDRGMTKNLMCIQAVLNGDPLIIKETGETIYPTEGFMIVATGNTKGQGDTSDRFLATECLDESLLERFPICLEQSYPPLKTEIKILQNNGMDDVNADLLANWALQTRKSYEAGASENFITTRRLCHIAANFGVFGKMKKSIELACSRFTPETKNSFVELYRALSPLAEADNNEDHPEGEE